MVASWRGHSDVVRLLLDAGQNTHVNISTPSACIEILKVQTSFLSISSFCFYWSNFLKIREAPQKINLPLLFQCPFRMIFYVHLGQNLGSNALTYICFSLDLLHNGSSLISGTCLLYDVFVRNHATGHGKKRAICFRTSHCCYPSIT